MKKLFLFACIFSFGYTMAQTKNNDKLREKIKSLQDSGKVVYVVPNSPHTLLESQAKLSHVLPNGNKVYSLPLDNMPCIVPNMEQWKAMPNTSNNKSYLLDTRRKVPKLIPNPGLRSTPLIPNKVQKH